MKTRQKLVDRNPEESEAGMKLKIQKDENTKKCLEFEERPPTPDKIKQWKRFESDVGKTNLHPGFRGC